MDRVFLNCRQPVTNSNPLKAAFVVLYKYSTVLWKPVNEYLELEGAARVHWIMFYTL